MSQTEKIQKIREDLEQVLSRSISRADTIALTDALTLLSSLEVSGSQPASLHTV